MVESIISLTTVIVLLGITALMIWPGKGIISRWNHIRRQSSRVLREDALKHIYITGTLNGRATIQSIAGALQINQNRTAGLIEDLEEHNLVTIEDGRLSLTPEGRTYALQIIRAHRLWEQFLAEETGYKETEWHQQAEHHEHLLSLQETKELAAKLGNPSYDPHGDPIPTDEGQIVSLQWYPLTSVEVDQPVRIVHIEDEPETIYAQLVAEGLQPGMDIQIIEKTSQRVQFLANGEEHILAPIIANNISVISLPKTYLVEQISQSRLVDLKKGQKGRVLLISKAIRGVERRRLLDLGILPGTTICKEIVSPNGDPSAYRVRGALIALRNDQTEHIYIKKMDQAR